MFVNTLTWSMPEELLSETHELPAPIILLIEGFG
jgi:hypothetical protein